MCSTSSITRQSKKKYALTCQSLSLDEARKIAIHRQGLGNRARSPITKSVIFQTIDALGLVQLDSVNVVDRSHYLVMLSRLGVYDKKDLDALVWPGQKIAEQWAHAASLIPSQDYKYYYPALLKKRDSLVTPKRLLKIGSSHNKVIRFVLDEITLKGALRSRDFTKKKRSNHAWWNRSPIREALNLLFRQGELYIKERIGFEPVYDLVERHPILSKPSPKINYDDWLRWSTLRAVKCLGVGTLDHISDYYRQPKPAVRQVIDSLVEEKVVAIVKIESWENPAYYIQENYDHLPKKASAQSATTFLSPFDNLIWHRGRVKDLFGFEYRTEMYTPMSERVHGYYCMPILHDGRLVGRIDPKNDRLNRTLIIKSLSIHDSEEINDSIMVGLQKALDEMMVFLNCKKLIIEKSSSKQIKEQLLCQS